MPLYKAWDTRRRKGAFIIYLGGGLWWFWGVVTLFSYYDLGAGVWKISNENDIEDRGDQPFFSWKRKGNENMLLDPLIIPVFYFIWTKCWYRTRVWSLMHDTHFLCYKVSLRVAQTHSRHPSSLSLSPHSQSPQTRSPHSHALQELKMTCEMMQHQKLLCSGLMKIISVL